MYDDNTTDSDGQVSTLFHDTTTHLEPDVAVLVRGSIERGQVRRRRNAIGTAAAAAVAVAGIVGAAVNLTPNLGGAGFDPAGAPAGTAVSTPSAASNPSTAPTPSAAPAKTAKPPTKPTKNGPLGGAVADIPVKAADLPGLFTQLHPGKVTPAEARTGRIIDNGKESQYAHFLWNGFSTSVGFAAYAGTPVGRCNALQEANGAALSLTCTKRPDGTVLMTWRSVGSAKQPGVCQSASLLTKDGYEIAILSYNTALKFGPMLAPEPPFSIAQLTTAVTSKVWF
ncbi:hypothetical protein [Kribbella catacumbae]|uniref:hypothetical protein n=1 Tax=Kribbella catacumbae TaxID=460086 RepID=UPI0003A0FD38|nr:hypothetical protein [Kribbella catacumbae]